MTTNISTVPIDSQSPLVYLVPSAPLLWIYLAVRLSSIYIVLFPRLPVQLVRYFFFEGVPGDVLVSKMWAVMLADEWEHDVL